MAEKQLSAAEIHDIASKFDITRGGLQATVTVAEAADELNPKRALDAARALLMILTEIEV